MLVWLTRIYRKHAATMAGMASASGDWVVTLDEDGQQDPADILLMLDTALDIAPGRISTLYRTGQSAGKKQGWLSHIARSIVRSTPFQIFVPFDTIRDYLTATDAAVRMIMALRQNDGQSRLLIQLVASEHPTTIVGILATFKRFRAVRRWW